MVLYINADISWVNVKGMIPSGCITYDITIKSIRMGFFNITKSTNYKKRVFRKYFFLYLIVYSIICLIYICVCINYYMSSRIVQKL